MQKKKNADFRERNMLHCLFVNREQSFCPHSRLLPSLEQGRLSAAWGPTGKCAHRGDACWLFIHGLTSFLGWPAGRFLQGRLKWNPEGLQQQGEHRQAQAEHQTTARGRNTQGDLWNQCNATHTLFKRIQTIHFAFLSTAFHQSCRPLITLVEAMNGMKKQLLSCALQKT